MQVLHPQIMSDLRLEAKHRGVTVQELLRALVIPEWLEVYKAPFTPAQLRVYLLKKGIKDYKRGYKTGERKERKKWSGKSRQSK